MVLCYVCSRDTTCSALAGRRNFPDVSSPIGIGNGGFPLVGSALSDEHAPERHRYSARRFCNSFGGSMTTRCHPLSLMCTPTERSPRPLRGPAHPPMAQGGMPCSPLVLQEAHFGKTRCRARLWARQDGNHGAFAGPHAQWRDAMHAAIRTLQDSAGLSAVRTADLRDGLRIAEIPASSAMLLESIGVAIVNGDPDQMGRLSVQAMKSDSILAVEPERVVYAASRFSLPSGIGVPTGAASPGSEDEAINRDYMRGFRDGFDHATGLCFAPGAAPPAARLALRPAAIDESAVTWGLQATRSWKATTPAGVSR